MLAKPGIVFEELPPIDVVMFSHNHYDHMDIATLRRLNVEHDPLIVTPLGNDAILRRALPDVRVVAGDWWDRVDIGNGGELVGAWRLRQAHGALVRFHPAHERWLCLFCRRHRLWRWAHFQRDAATDRQARSGAEPHRRIRPALDYERAAHRSERGGSDV